ncbi:DUF1365 domain-containing protein [Sulfitobacter mediterraneus]|uniref:Cyclopropane-fatty-acyl-phospholipid synthase n=1 Tax=Sulfitobacter mediterraneus TaxID=83219 RepID=A0A061STS7_9RHOB|nr:DUF1365 domain-containing protein [Sulfitobacter mediterraneus]KAJ04302.1 cyclopropane-fatty-acyl-phospholipid synthase [Sulfitobacter mediterraneus]
MRTVPEYISGVTTHTRKGAVRHGFRYGVDYVMIDPEQDQRSPFLFSRNRFNFSAVHDVDHGGPLGAGRGPAWARAALRANGLPDRGVDLRLLTQPRFLGYVFNPVSFWLAFRGSDLVAVIAEVSTPFHDRHSYLCHLPGFAPITGESRIEKPKWLHVSPYQDVAGHYQFGFDIREDQIAIRIIHKNGEEGVVATLSGPRVPMTSPDLIKASLRRPLGAMRTIGLIYWQALILKLKGANYRSRPTPPKTEVS